MKQQYESEVLYKLMERDGLNIPSSVPPYESEIKQYFIEQIKLAYPKLTDYEAEWLLYNYIEYIPADFPIETALNVTQCQFENVVPYAYKSAILKGQTLINLKYQEKTINNGKKYVTIKNFSNNKQYIAIFPYITNAKYAIYNMTTNSFIIGYKPSNKLIFTSPSSTDEVRLYVAFDDENIELPSNALDIVCVEYQQGMENWDIPYFEGMQSVKMPVLTTTGKNLWSYGNNLGEFDIKYIKVSIPRGSYYFSGEPSKTYDKPVVVALRDKTKQLIAYGNLGSRIETDFEVAEAVIYSNGYSYNNSINNFLSVKNFMMEKDTFTGIYEPYKSNILTVNEDVTLRGIGDVRDTLDCLTGEVTERIEEIVLDGGDDEEWIITTGGSATHQRFVLNRGSRIKPISNVNENLFSCDKFKPVTKIKGENSQEMCLIEHFDDYFASIIIEKKKLNSVTVDGFKSWLQSNNVKIQYAVENESIKTVDLSVVNQDGEECYFMPIEGTMHMSTNGQPIKPLLDVEVPVEAITQNLASFINMKMTDEVE